MRPCLWIGRKESKSFSTKPASDPNIKHFWGVLSLAFSVTKNSNSKHWMGSSTTLNFGVRHLIWRYMSLYYSGWPLSNSILFYCSLRLFWHILIRGFGSWHRGQSIHMVNIMWSYSKPHIEQAFLSHFFGGSNRDCKTLEFFWGWLQFLHKLLAF